MVSGAGDPTARGMSMSSSVTEEAISRSRRTSGLCVRVFDPDTRVVSCTAKGGQSIVRLRAGRNSAQKLVEFIQATIPLSRATVVQSPVDGEDEARVLIPNACSVDRESTIAAERSHTARTLGRWSNYFLCAGIVLLLAKQVVIINLMTRSSSE